MATRQSMENLLQQCEDVIRFAQDQYETSSKQENYNDDGYVDALQQLEATYNDIASMSLHANAQQREMLHRKRLQLQQVQNNMILRDL